MAFDFDHPDVAYRRWLRENPTGYVVNVDKSNPQGTRVHKVSCSFIQGPVDRNMNLTDSYPKICAPTLDELAQHWAGGKKCSFCAP
jgi:hypothetical protein